MPAMGFESMRGRGTGRDPNGVVTRERSSEEQVEAARTVAAGMQKCREQVEMHLGQVAGSKTIAEWEAARSHLAAALTDLDRLIQGSASLAAHADADTAVRLLAAESIRAELVARAEAHIAPPAFSAPPLACEAALLAALPSDQTAGGPIRSVYEAAEASVGEILVTISAAETPVVARRLSDPNDPLGRRFARFSAERRGKLLSILRSRRRLLATAAGKVPGTRSPRPVRPPPDPEEQRPPQPPAQAPVAETQCAYAIVAIEDAPPDAPGWPDRVSVERIVWSQEAAREQVERLSQLHADKGRRYFWQLTTVDRP